MWRRGRRERSDRSSGLLDDEEIQIEVAALELRALDHEGVDLDPYLAILVADANQIEDRELGHILLLLKVGDRQLTSRVDCMRGIPAAEFSRSSTRRWSSKLSGGRPCEPFRAIIADTRYGCPVSNSRIV